MRLLRRALEVAVAVVRDAPRGAPAGPGGPAPPPEPPRRLVPLLRFTRLPDRALTTVASVLDDDAALRSFVVESGRATEEVVGRAGWLFLARPDGWDEELVDLAAAAALAERQRVAERADRLDRARRDAVESLRRAAAELDDERRRRVQAEAAVAALQERLAAVERDRDDLAARLARAQASVVDPTPAAEGPRSRPRTTRARPAAPTAAEASPPPVVQPAGPAAPPAPAPPAPAPPTAVPPAGPAGPPAPAPAAPPAPAPPARPARPARPAGPAAPPAPPTPPGPAPSGPPARPAERRDSTDSGASRDRRRPPVRLPLALPRGLLDDTPAAADHLVRTTPPPLLLVDGYNATLQAWATLPLGEQRRRLADALGELAARTGVQVIVVFDGDAFGDGAGSGTHRAGRGAGRGGVRVRFSTGGDEADDLILALLEDAPRTRGVVVATDDQRVRRLAAAGGANLLTREQLFHLLRLRRS